MFAYICVLVLDDVNNFLLSHSRLITPQKKEEGGSSVSKSVVFTPDPIKWHITRNKDEYNLLTVSSTIRIPLAPITV